MSEDFDLSQQAPRLCRMLIVERQVDLLDCHVLPLASILMVHVAATDIYISADTSVSECTPRRTRERVVRIAFLFLGAQTQRDLAKGPSANEHGQLVVDGQRVLYMPQNAQCVRNLFTALRPNNVYQQTDQCRPYRRLGGTPSRRGSVAGPSHSSQYTCGTHRHRQVLPTFPN